MAEEQDGANTSSSDFDLKLQAMDIPAATKQEAAKAREWMHTLNSPDFQEDDIVAAMDFCRIVDTSYKFLPQQKPIQPLRWWQVCLVLWAHKVRQKNKGLGGLCADAIGTGKTKGMLRIALLVS